MSDEIEFNTRLEAMIRTGHAHADCYTVKHSILPRVQAFDSRGRGCGAVWLRWWVVGLPHNKLEVSNRLVKERVKCLLY